jgi:hypothetical protein
VALTFELDSLMLGANFAYVFFRDPAALDRARLGIRQRLDRAAPRVAALRSRRPAAGHAQRSSKRQPV